jgi:hypothetical protein
MRFEIGGGASDELAFGILDDERAGAPAGARDRRFRLLERVEEGVRDEGVKGVVIARSERVCASRRDRRIGASVPGSGVDLAEG